MKGASVFKSLVGVLAILVMVAVSSHAEETTIKIGFVGDFDGVTKDYCQGSYQAAQIAVDEINKAGGLLGRPVELIKRDAGPDPEKHNIAFNSIVWEENVVAVFGGASSPCILRASEAARDQKIPYLISIGNTQAVVVEKGHPYVFLFEANSWMETKGFSIFTTLMPWKRYAWVGPDYTWGHEVFAYFQQHFAEIGAPIDWVAEAWHPLGHGEFSTIIPHLIKADPDALVIASWGKDMLEFTRLAKQAGLFDKMAAFGWFFLQLDDKERLIPEGVWTLTRAPFNYLVDKYPQTRSFVETYHQRYNAYPIDFTICGYDAVTAWKLAVQKANSAEPEAVARALKGLSFEGMRGQSHIRAVDGQINCPTYFGRLVYLPEYPAAVLDSVFEIPADKTWLSEKEVLARRAVAGN